MKLAFKSSCDYFTLLVKPTMACNLRCGYCYQRRNSLPRTGKMGDDTLRALIERACRLPVSEIYLQWIGGETLLAGVGFFKKALEYQDELNVNNIHFRHAIQTNGTLLNEEWFRFFREHPGFGLSVSFDLFEELQNANRRTPAGGGTYEKVRKNLQSLQSLEIPFGVLITIGSRALEYPAEQWIEKLVREKLFYVGLQLDYDIYSSMSPAMVGRYLAFLEELFNCQAQYNQSVTHPEDKLLIRESYYLFNRIAGLPRQKQSCHNSRDICLDYLLSVDVAGNVYACCDAFLGRRMEKYGDFVIGNIERDDFEAMFSSPLYQDLYRDMQKGRSHCAGCECYTLCMGGCNLFRALRSGSPDSPPDVSGPYCMYQEGCFSFVTDAGKRMMIRRAYEYLE